jgi:hypothetical protein
MQKRRVSRATFATLFALTLAGCSDANVAAPSNAVPQQAAAPGQGTEPVWPDRPCGADHLSARFVADPNLSQAGAERFTIVLTNTSDRSCSYYGWPGALLLDANGAVLTRSEPMTMAFSPGALAPDEAAHLEGQLTAADAYDCTPTVPTTIRVVFAEGDDRQGVDASTPLLVCDEDRTELMIGPFLPGS